MTDEICALVTSAGKHKASIKDLGCHRDCTMIDPCGSSRRQSTSYWCNTGTQMAEGTKDNLIQFYRSSGLDTKTYLCLFAERPLRDYVLFQLH